MEALPTELIHLILGPANDYRCEDHDNARLVCKAWRVAIPRRKSPLMLVSKATANWASLCESPFITGANFLAYGGPLLDAYARSGRMALADIAAHPGLPHDWATLSRRDDLTTSFILAHADREWDFTALSCYGPSRLHEAVDALPEKPWAFQVISCHRWLNAFGPGAILNHPDKDWDWRAVSDYRDDRINTLIMALPHKSWSYAVLSRNRHVHEETMFALSDKAWDLPAFVAKHEVSTKMAIFLDQRGMDHWEDVEAPDFNLNLEHSSDMSDDAFRSLSYFTTINYSVVAKLAHKPWLWREISDSSTLDMKTLKAHPHMPWDWELITPRGDLDMTIVAAHPEKPWDWQRLSAHERLSIDLVAATRGKPWDWGALAINAAIPFEHMMRHPELPWIFYIKG